MSKYVDRVISERPYVKLLTEPSGQLPMIPGCPTRMTAVAQVQESLCVIEVTVDVEQLTGQLRPQENDNDN